MAATDPDHTSKRSIHVTGIGKVSTPADKADLILAVEVQAKTVDSASAQTASIMAAVLKAIKNQGVAERDIQTRSVSLFPNYSADAASKIIGYHANNQVIVTIRDISKASAIIDAGISSGGNATRLQGISFSVANPEVPLAEAREKAFANAKTKAEQYAKLAGVSLDAPLHITEGSEGQPAPAVFTESFNMRAAIADRVSTPIQSGDQEVSVTVDVVFGIH